MKKSIIFRFLFLVVLCMSGQMAFAQITLTMSGTGKHPSTVATNPATLVLYKSNGTDCEATVTFTNSAGVAVWKVYETATFGFPPLGVMKDGATDVVLSPDALLGSSYTHPGMSSTFTITLKSTSVFSGGFAIQTDGINDIEVGLNTLNLSCSVAPLLVSVSLTPTTDLCIAAGENYPKYDITVTDNLSAASGPKVYDLSLVGGPSGLALISPNITVTGALRTVTITGGLGGQLSPGAAATSTFTVKATEQGGTVFGESPANTINVNPNCNKNALVVKVDPSGAAPVWTTEPIDTVTEAQAWVARVSYGNALFNPIVRSGTNAPIILENPFSFYNNSTTIPLQTPIDSLVQEVVKKLGIELTTIDHLLLFLNTTTPADVGPAGYWAVNKMTYKTGATTKTLSVSINPRNAGWKQVAHGIGHQFGLVDLSYFDPATGIVNPFITPIGFDIMAIPANGSGQPDINSLQNIHPLAESKFALTSGPSWINNGNVEFIASGNTPVSSVTRTIIPASKLTAATDKVGIALGLSGATSLSSEKYYVWLEARPFNAEKDKVGAGSAFDGVVAYYSTKDIKSGVGRVKWYDLVPTTPLNLKFAYTVVTTGEKKIGTSGWSIKSLTKTGYNYAVELAYTPPVGVYDAYVSPGITYSWLSPDIETRIPGCEGTACAETSGEKAGLIAGDVDTRVIGTVHNKADVPVDVVVKFSISRTTVTAIGALSKTEFASVFTTIPPKSGGVDGIVKPFGILNLKFIEGTSWGPDLIAALNAHTSHYCLFVDIIPVTPGEGPNTNNVAQKNSGFVEISHNSPYPPLEYSFYVSNPDNKPRVIFFGTKNVPGNWDFKLSPAHVTLAPNQEQKVDMYITIPPDFPDCTDFPIQITASMLSDHTLVPLDGIMPFLKLRKNETITIAAGAKTCYPDSLLQKYGNNTRVTGLPTAAGGERVYNNNNYGQLMDYYLKQFLNVGKNGTRRGCATIYISGCTNPVQPNTAVTIMYQDPAGNPIFKQVMTDASGCYSDEHVVVEGGDWKTTAIFNGDACYASASMVTEVTVPLPVTGDQDGDGLKDVDEFQGDEDGDGIPGQLDTDSDNDGIKDGDEPKGNYDCDSYDNVIDSDSDNDGIPDGKDPTPYGWTPRYRIFFSGMYHRFDFDKKLPIRDGNGFNIRLGVNLNPYWGIEGEVGSTPTQDTAQKSGKVYNLNLNGLYYLGTKPIVPYLTAGVGTLLFNGFSKSDNTFALNGGIGIIGAIPNISGLGYRAEIKAHYGFGGYNTNGNLNMQYSLGIIYRIRTNATPCNIQRVIKQSKK